MQHIYSVPILAYEFMFKHLNDISEKFFYKEIKTFSDLELEFCVRFHKYTRGLVRVSDIFCAILKHDELIQSVQYSPALVFRIELKLKGLFDLYVCMHNRFISVDGPEVLQKYIDDLNVPVNSMVKSIELFCSQLLSGSNVLGKNFVMVAACVNGLQLCVRKLQRLFFFNMRNKRTRLSQNRAITVSRGIHGIAPIAYDYDYDKLPVNVFFYLKKLEKYCDPIVEQYNYFLFQEMQEKYTCKFEKLLFCTAKAVIMNHGQEIFPRKGLFVTDGTVVVCDSTIEHGSMQSIKRRINCQAESSSKCKKARPSYSNIYPAEGGKDTPGTSQDNDDCDYDYETLEEKNKKHFKENDYSCTVNTASTASTANTDSAVIIYQSDQFAFSVEEGKKNSDYPMSQLVLESLLVVEGELPQNQVYGFMQ
ncbi:hypothetical protein K6025_05075 [Ehrlichia sp. JZT12]